MSDESDRRGLIAWFARNPVAANLLMLMIIAFGIVSAFSIRKQTTPDFELNTVQVRVPYLGAAPQEVEEGVVVKVEEAIQDIDGIVEIRSLATEGRGTVTAEISSDADLNEVLNEIKTRVDAISTFPGLAEKPVIFKQEIPIHVVFVALHGDLDDFMRKALAQQIRDELMAIPAVNQVEILGDRAYEISVEVSETALRKFGLTIGSVADAIRRSSLDLPGGVIKSSGGDILLRTEGQVYTGTDFESIVLLSRPDGTRLTIGDVATIDDGFVETDGYGRFNGKPTATLRVLSGGQQNELRTAAVVRDYIATKTADLPPGVEVDVWVDRAHYLRGRLDMMLSNLFQGALLVFLILTLFLRLKVAFWVIVGIPVTFFGALWLMPHGPWPVTVNVISLFGLILVLGIVVDDAIIIGESIYTKIRADGHTVDNVIDGAHRVAIPATFGVLTTIAVFAPLLFVGGIPGPLFEAMAVVVILCLVFSLVESKLILPAHLAHATMHPVDEDAIFRPYGTVAWYRRLPKFFQRVQRRFQHALQYVIHQVYEPMLRRSIDNAGLTVTIFTAVLIVTFGVIGSGLTRIVLFPEVPGDFIQMTLEMQTGTPPDKRNEALDRLEEAILQVNGDYVRNNPDAQEPVNHVGVFTNGATGGLIFVELPLNEDRPLEPDDITKMWRANTGEIPGVRELTFSDGNNIGGGAPLSFNLSGDNYDLLEAASSELADKLGEYEGVFDIRNSLNSGGQEIKLNIKPEGEALGVTQAMLGNQVRQAFYGEEAQRIQRGKDEVKVMVRYPREQRGSVADLENMRIRTPGGAEVPFGTVAEVSYGKAFSTINRQDRKRTVTVSADLDPLKVEPGRIIREVSEEYLPELVSRYPGVSSSLEGSSLEEQKLIRNLTVASIAALFLIYALIAIPLKSYVQPLIILSVIPFGLVGAVIGHVLMGKAISMFSLFGFIALAGVVVNDSLIMMDFINKARARGMALTEAVAGSGTQRFRAIILTSLTTAGGLLPIMFETSVQAQFVIPMAISLAFGILFATVITLFLIPALYVFQLRASARFRRIGRWMLGRDPTLASQP